MDKIKPTNVFLNVPTELLQMMPQDYVLLYVLSTQILMEIHQQIYVWRDVLQAQIYTLIL